MTDDFPRLDQTGQKLFDSVCSMPIIDWHNHLSVNDLTCNRNFSDLTELWIAPDPYKHRAMRLCGIPEKQITGPASNYEKFQVWSSVLPQLAGNPLYHWSRLELLRVFGIEEELNPSTAEKIWKHANAQLKKPEMSARNLLEHFHVEYASPCAGLSDDLGNFAPLKGIVPSLRGDDLLSLSNSLFGTAQDLSDFQKKLLIRLKEFHEAGCRFADHAIDGGFHYMQDDGKNSQRFDLFKAGKLPAEEREMLASEILRTVGKAYAQFGWTLQLHIGAMRRTSSRLRTVAGPAGGYAGISSSCDIRMIANLLDDLEQASGGLPRTILYTLNPADHAMFAVLSGSFAGDGVRGKVMLGPAWWFCDHIHGMRDVFENTAAYSVLSVFPGMTTDSRSILSFVRHEYFRRVFCAWLSEKVQKGEMPPDFKMLRELTEKVCYFNAKAMIQ